MTIPTKERLAQAIEARYDVKPNPMIERRVQRMIRAARAGQYDDYESELVAPTSQLVADLRYVAFYDLALRVIDGEFDCTKEEGEAWMQREGWELLLGKKPGSAS